MTPNSKLNSTDEYLGYICKGCKSITEVILPNGTNVIGKYAFIGCSMLKKIAIPNSVTYIGRDAFSDSGIEEIKLPDSLIELGYESLARTKLTNVTFPQSITKLNGSELSDMTTIIWIKCLPVIPPIGANDHTFMYNKVVPIYVPDDSLDSYKVATGMTYYATRFRKLSQFDTDFPNG